MIIQKIKQYTAGQQGYVFVLVAVILPLLFAAGALAVDVGYVYVAKTALQNAADAAALAGSAQSDDDTTDVNSVVKTYIQRNSAADNTITVSSSESTDASIPDTENSIYALTNAIKQTNGSTTLRVTLGERVPTFFLKFFGFTTFPVAVVATAEYTPGGSSGTSDEFGGLFGNVILGDQNIYFNTTGITITGNVQTNGTITMDNHWAAAITSGEVIGYTGTSIWGIYGWYTNQKGVSTQGYYTIEDGSNNIDIVPQYGDKKDISLANNSVMSKYIAAKQTAAAETNSTTHVYSDYTGSSQSFYTNSVNNYTGLTNQYDRNYTLIVVSGDVQVNVQEKLSEALVVISLNGNIQANVQNTKDNNLMLISENGNISLQNSVAVNVWAYAPNGTVLVDGSGATVTGSLVGKNVKFTSWGQQIVYSSSSNFSSSTSDSGNSSSSSTKGSIKLIDDNKYVS